MTDIALSAIFAARKDSTVFEDAIERFYSDIVSAGDTVVDVGSNIGLHTYPLAELVGRQGEVHAFEVLPPLLDRMRTLGANSPQIKLHPAALSNVSGQNVPFKWNKNALGHSGLRDRDHGGLLPDVGMLSVETATVDELLPQLHRWAFFKLDLEGGEFYAMQGARRNIELHRPAITFENGRGPSAKEYGYAEAEFFGLFNELGYGIYDIIG